MVRILQQKFRFSCPYELDLFCPTRQPAITIILTQYCFGVHFFFFFFPSNFFVCMSRRPISRFCHLFPSMVPHPTLLNAVAVDTLVQTSLFYSSHLKEKWGTALRRFLFGVIVRLVLPCNCSRRENALAPSTRYHCNRSNSAFIFFNIFAHRSYHVGLKWFSQCYWHHFS